MRMRQVDIHAKIKFQIETFFDDQNVRYVDGKPKLRVLDTTVGRALFNRIVPAEVRYMNRKLDKSDVQKFIGSTFTVLGNERSAEVVDFVDAIKNIGFKYATRSGVSIAISDIEVPSAKAEHSGGRREQGAGSGAPIPARLADR